MRGLIKLLILVVIAAGLTIYHIKTSEREETRALTERISQRVFPHGDEEDVTLLTESIAEIRVTASGSSLETVLERASAEWAITSPRQLPADTSAANSLARTLAGLELAGPPMDAVLTDIPSEDLWHFGLSSPEVRVAVRYEGEDQPRALALGGQDPSGADRYALDVETGDVMVIADRLTALDKSLFDLRDKRIWQEPADQALGVEVRNASGEIIWSVVRPETDDEWRITAPLTDEADTSQANAIFGQLLGARAVEFVGEDLSQEQIDAFAASAERVATLTFETAEGVVAQRTLLIGEVVGDNRRIAFAESDQIIEIGENSLRNLMGDVTNLQSKTVVLFDPESIDRVVHSSNSLNSSFERTAEDTLPWRAVQPIEGVSPETVSEAVESLVRNAHSLRGRDVLPPEEAAEAMTQHLSPPAVTLTLVNASEEAIVEIGGLTEREGMMGHHLHRVGRDAVLFAEDWRVEDLILDDLVP